MPWELLVRGMVMNQHWSTTYEDNIDCYDCRDSSGLCEAHQERCYTCKTPYPDAKPILIGVMERRQQAQHIWQCSSCHGNWDQGG